MDYIDPIDELIDDGLQGSGLRQLARFPNFNHSSPLTYYPQKHIVNLYSGREPQVPKIALFEECLGLIDQINSRHGLTHRVTEDPTRFYVRLLKQSTSKSVYASEKGRKLLSNSLRACLYEINGDLDAIMNSHPGLSHLRELSHINVEQLDALVSTWGSAFDIYRGLVGIRNEIQLRHVNGTGRCHEPLGIVAGFQFHAHNEMLFLRDTRDTGVIVIANYDQLLMLTDTLSNRFFCILACSINDIVDKDDLPSTELLISVYKWGDSVLSENGMAGYALIGEFEAIVTDAFVNYPGSDPLGLGVQFRAFIYQMAEEKFEEFGIDPSHTRELQGLLTTVNSPNVLSEIFGLRKHWGNPMVDATASAKSVQDKLMEELPINGSAVVRLHASFNRLITLEYIRKNGKWPDCFFPDSASEFPICKAWKQKTTRIPEDSPDHTHLHWALLKFRSNCVIDSYQDQLSIISDKSVSLYRDKLDFVYVSALHNIQGKSRPQENRRLMLEFLRRDHMPILDIFWTVMTNSIPFNWLCNSSSMKGTEMKHEKARIFAVLTYELRQYFSVTEEMIKDHIFRYNPHQTMTMKEGELLERLRSITRQLQQGGGERFLNVIHIIDFSKWNLRMRYRNTWPVFKSIDDFMGTPGLVEQSHLLFEAMINLVQDPFNPPDSCVEEADIDTIWKFHGCGWEGQRQKGWTVITSALLSQIELVTSVHSEICGQGDNQVLVSRFDVPSIYTDAQEWMRSNPGQVRSVVDQYYQVLERECTLIGLKVKSAETCRSLCYLNYGKRLFFNGVELSMTLKRISKIMTEPNSSYPTTEGRLKTQEGNIYAANLYGHPSLTSYIVSRVGLYITLWESYTCNPLLGDLTGKLIAPMGANVASKFIAGLMRIPASLGGPPQQGLVSFLLRGHPDPLCEDLVMLRLRELNGDRLSRRVLSEAMKRDWYNLEVIERQSLIQSPYSLNLKIPQSALKPIERQVNAAANQYCKNSSVKEMFSSQMDSYSEALIQTLSLVTPFHPGVLNDIFARTPPGRKAAFLGGLSNSTSLGRLVYESSMNPIVNRVVRGELLQLNHWVQLWERISKAPIPDTVGILRHDQLAQSMRDLSWQTEVVGITVPHPLELFIMVKCQHDICTQSCLAGYPERISLVVHNEDLVHIPFRYKPYMGTSRSFSTCPYLGNTIVEGITQVDLHCDNPTSSWQDVIRLNILRKWVTSSGEHLDQLLQHVISTRTNVPLDIVDRASGKPSRFSYSHRAALLSAVKDCAPSTTTNIHTRMYVSSNLMGQYSRGDVNYHLPFGPAFLTFESLLALELTALGITSLESSSDRDIFHCHIRSHTVPIVYDGDLILSEISPLPQVHTPSLLFARAEELEFTDVTGKSVSSIWSDPETASLEDSRVVYGYQLLANNFISELVSHELSSLDGVEHYPPRSAPITIGDIRNIGVQLFCRVIAMNTLIYSPMRVLVQPTPAEFLNASYRYIDKLSSTFWGNFTRPLSNPRLLIELQRLAGSVSSHDATRVSSGVVQLLKVVVSKEMCDLWEDLKSAVFQGSRTPNLILACPSVRTAKSIISRYFELCILTLLPGSALAEHVVIAYARDLVANIHSVPDERLPAAVNLCAIGFVYCSKLILGSGAKTIPSPKVYFMRDTWVERIRGGELTAIPKRKSVEAMKQTLAVHFTHISDNMVPADVLLYGKEACLCPDPDRPRDYHLECLYTPVGILSKSHYKFLEIILSFNLDISFVACLGTSTGTEAASIAKFSECRGVYVNCFHKIKTFDPHTAATYIPPAFMVEDIPEKLINPGPAAISPSDLLNPNCIEAILAHLDGIPVSGMTCDAELPDEFNERLFYQLLDNILVLILRMPSVQWLIIKIPTRCHHVVQSVLSKLSMTFERCIASYSSFNRARSRSIHYLGMNRRTLTLGFDSDIVIPSVLASDSYWVNAIANISMATLPPCLSIRPSIMIRKMRSCGVIMGSFRHTCMTALHGFGITYIDPPPRSVFRSELERYKCLIHREIMDRVQVSYRTFNALPIIRSLITQQGASLLAKDVVKLCNDFLRAELILELTSTENLCVEKLIEGMDRFLSEPHRVPIGDNHYLIQIDQQHFMRRASRFVLEIIGTLYHHELQRANINCPRVFHRHQYIWPSERIDVGLLQFVPFTNYLQRPVQCWKWHRRCFLVSLLYVAYWERGSRIYVSGRLSHMLSGQNLQSLFLSDLISFDVTKSQTAIYFDPDLETVNRVLGPECGNVYLVIPNPLFKYVSANYEILSVVYSPWSGVVPGHLICRPYRFVREREGWYVDLMASCRMFDPLGFELANCSCYSCSFERFYCKERSVSHSFLDRVCSTYRIESIFNKYHRY